MDARQLVAGDLHLRPGGLGFGELLARTECQRGIVQGGQVAVQPHCPKTQRGERRDVSSGQVVVDHAVADLIDLLAKLLHHRSQQLGHLREQLHQHLRRRFGRMIGRETQRDRLGRSHAALDHRDDAAGLQPDPDGFHVLGHAGRVEVDPATDEHQPLLGLHAARAGVVRDQRLGLGDRDARFLNHPAPNIAARLGQVQPSPATTHRWRVGIIKLMPPAVDREEHALGCELGIGEHGHQRTPTIAFTAA